MRHIVETQHKLRQVQTSQNEAVLGKLDEFAAEAPQNEVPRELVV